MVIQIKEGTYEYTRMKELFPHEREFFLCVSNEVSDEESLNCFRDFLGIENNPETDNEQNNQD